MDLSITLAERLFFLALLYLLWYPLKVENAIININIRMIK